MTEINMGLKHVLQKVQNGTIRYPVNPQTEYNNNPNNLNNRKITDFSIKKILEDTSTVSCKTKDTLIKSSDILDLSKRGQLIHSSIGKKYFNEFSQKGHFENFMNNSQSDLVIKPKVYKYWNTSAFNLNNNCDFYYKNNNNYPNQYYYHYYQQQQEYLLKKDISFFSNEPWIDSASSTLNRCKYRTGISEKLITKYNSQPSRSVDIIKEQHNSILQQPSIYVDTPGIAPALVVDDETCFRCQICDKVFGCANTLQTHVRTHKSPRYECVDCGKGFSQLRNYKYHISVHRGTKEFAAECPECGKVFNDKGYLSSHMKIHRNKKEYECPYCPKSFNQRVAFNMHVRIHTGVKPHKCAECGKRFSRKMLLKQHMRTHSGEKPYTCSVCGKSFADRSNMTLHHRLHSGIKPFTCPICPKAFTKKHHLKTHLNYHTGCKPYICPHPNCNQAFTQSSNMRTHAKKCQYKPSQIDVTKLSTRN